MAEAAATESFAPLPGRFFGTGFAKGGRGRRLHVLHSGAAASRRYCIEADTPFHIRPCKSKRAIKKAVCFGAHCFLSSFQFPHDFLERVQKGGGPRKRGVAGNLHQIAALLQSYGAPLSKKDKKAAVRWARRQGGYFCGFRTRLTIRPGTTISLTTSMPSK